MTRPLLSCECVVCESHAGEAQAVQVRIARLTQERDWQYEENIELIARVAALESERDAHLFALSALHREVAALEQDLFAARDALLTEGQARIVLEARVAALEREDRLKTEADEACAQAAEAEIARLQARLAALTAALKRIAFSALGGISGWEPREKELEDRLIHLKQIADEALDAAAGGA